MTLYQNPFFLRTSQQQAGEEDFVRTFGAGVINRLPEHVWDRLVIIRSAKGAGKTSLLRAFSTSAVETVRRKYPTLPVHDLLQERGVLGPEGIRKLGVLIEFDRDYKALVDLAIGAEARLKLFYRLLDARIAAGLLQAVSIVIGRPLSSCASSIELRLRDADPRNEMLLKRLGGDTGIELLKQSRAVELDTIRRLDALSPHQLSGAGDGHSGLHSFAVLSNASLYVDGELFEVQPLVMFDEGHKLHPTQRAGLLTELGTRDTSVARWYAERYEALSTDELLSEVGDVERDYESVELEPRSDTRAAIKMEGLLGDIANMRVADTLALHTRERVPFIDLLRVSDDDLLGAHGEEAIAKLRARVVALAAESQTPERYAEWIQDAATRRGYEAAVRWRELEILLVRDRRRQHDLFGETLSLQDAADRSSSSLREAAGLLIAEEFGLPYFVGSGQLPKLGNANVEQFLEVCGALFERMLARIGVGRSPRLDAFVQARVVAEASKVYWDRVRVEVPHGTDVQALVRGVAGIARYENTRPNVPYPPGVTGTALLMSEANKLLDRDYRSKHLGTERLFQALGSAVAHNVLWAKPDYSVKNSRYLVLYVNRLLCPMFGLPLGYGSFRERRMPTFIQWLDGSPTQTSLGEAEQEALGL